MKCYVCFVMVCEVVWVMRMMMRAGSMFLLLESLVRRSHLESCGSGSGEKAWRDDGVALVLEQRHRQTKVIFYDTLLVLTIHDTATQYRRTIILI